MTATARLATGRSAQFADSGGDLQLAAADIIPGSDVSDVAFTGLDGDVDDLYILFARIKNPTGTPANYYLRPNSSAANMTYQALSAAGATPVGGNGADGYIATANASGGQCFVKVHFTARRENGLRRHGLVHTIRENPEIELMGLIWDDTSTLLEELGIHSDVAGAIGTGSRFSLYRLAGQAVGVGSLTTLDVAKADVRLERVSATEIAVERYKGRYIVINNEAVDPGPAGTGLTNVGNLIDATGADAGSAPAISTRYFAYMSNSDASFAPLQLRLSATSWTEVDGVRYLGATGNAKNWRFVGWVATDSAGEFQKNQHNIWVVSYLNPLPFSGISIPASDPINPSSYAAPNSAEYVAINGGTNARVNFIYNADYVVQYSLQVTVDVPAGKTVSFGVAENSGPGFQQEADHVCSDGTELVNNTAVTQRMQAMSEESPTLYDGELSFVTAMGKGDGSCTIYANVNAGITPLCNATYIRCMVWA